MVTAMLLAISPIWTPMFMISDDRVAGVSKEERAVSEPPPLPRKTTDEISHPILEEIDRDGAISR